MADLELTDVKVICKHCRTQKFFWCTFLCWKRSVWAYNRGLGFRRNEVLSKLRCSENPREELARRSCALKCSRFLDPFRIQCRAESLLCGENCLEVRKWEIFEGRQRLLELPVIQENNSHHISEGSWLLHRCTVRDWSFFRNFERVVFHGIVNGRKIWATLGESQTRSPGELYSQQTSISWCQSRSTTCRTCSSSLQSCPSTETNSHWEGICTERPAAFARVATVVPITFILDMF